MALPTSKSLAIIAGVGPGTGTAVALLFSKLYHIVLLARTPASYNPAISAIEAAGGTVTGIPTDVTNEESLKAAMKLITETHFPEQEVRVGVFNLSGRWLRKPFADVTSEEWMAGVEAPTRGAFLFSKSITPLLQRSASTTTPSIPTTTHTPAPNTKYPPTLIFTGATASMRAAQYFSCFAPGKFAIRALSQALAKEFGPAGVHVAHAVIDGIIDTEATKIFPSGGKFEERISPDGIAQAYWNLHTQPRNAFTWEIDIRPWIEKW